MQNKNSKISCDFFFFWSSFNKRFANVLSLHPHWRGLSQIYCPGIQCASKVRLPCKSKGKGEQLHQRSRSFFILGMAMTIFSEVFGSQNLGAICPSVLGAAGVAWQSNHASGQWLSICCSVFWDKDHRGLCRSGVRQTVNWGSAWQIMQEIMIDVSGRAVWGA